MNDPVTPPEFPEETPQEAARSAAFVLVRVMGALLIAVLVLRSCVIEGCPVSGPSMEPTLMDGERVMVFKLPTLLSRLPGLGGWNPIGAGDLVVFERAEDDRRYVKRVIAVCPRDAAEGTGTRVLYEQGQVFIDNQRIEEVYLPESERESPLDYEAVLKPGEYFVLGDHRSVSKDSLRFGPVTHDEIIGVVVLRYWPLGQFSVL